MNNSTDTSTDLAPRPMAEQYPLTFRLTANLCERLDLGKENAAELINTLMATLMKPDREGFMPSDAQVQAFLMVANGHKLNPWLKEIHAFVDTRSGGIVPVVGIDGWINIINRHPEFDGMTFDYADVNGDEAVTCSIYKKGFSRPTTITEFMDECRSQTTAWDKTPRRMLRHRAIMQCGRVAFGIGGIHPDDETDGLTPLGGAQVIDKTTGEATDMMPVSQPRQPTQAAPRQPTGEVVDAVATTSRPTSTPAAAEAPWDDDQPVTKPTTTQAAPPAQAPKPTPAPTPEPAAAAAKPGADLPASDGQKAYLVNKAVAAKLKLDEVLALHDSEIATLTVGQFDSAKAWFLARN